MQTILTALTLSQAVDSSHPSLVLAPLCVGVAMAVLGAAVLAYERGSAESRAFLVLTKAIALWLIALAGMYAADTADAALAWARAAYIGVAAIAPAVYTFTVQVLRIASRRRVWYRAAWASSAVFMFCAVAPTPFLVGMHRYDWGVYARFGWIGFIFIAWTCTLLAASLLEYGWALRGARRRSRHYHRVRALAGAFVVGYIALVDFAPTLGVDVYPFGYVPMLLFLVASAWIIGRYHLVDLTPQVAAAEIIDTMADPLLVCDPDGRVRVTNRAVRRVLGYADHALVGQPVARVAGGRADAAERLATLVRDAPDGEWACVLETPAGDPVDVTLSASRLTTDDAELGTVLIARDDRERKRAERRREESEHRYRSLFEYNPDAVYSFDLQGRFLEANPVCESLSGYTRDELLQTPWMSLVVPEDRPWARRVFQKVMEGEPQRYELAITHRDGHRVELSGASIPIVIDGEIVGIHGVAKDITQEKRTEEELRHSAYHDPLTGIANRAAFMDQLGRALGRAQQREDYGFAVIFLDLDRFKVINDSLGHGVGDQVLVQLARRLGISLRPEDRVARLGGDEFGILLFNVRDASAATRIAERILQQFEKPFSVEGHEVYAAASMGIALSATGYERPEDVLRDADIAMYRAKERGGARLEVFDEAMHAQAVALLELETDLRRAIDRDEFRLLFQPIVELESGAPIGFEALLRWLHPQRGVRLPGEFVAVAEETGLIVPIGSWVLREACRIAVGWDDLPDGRAPFVSVNVSARQIVRPGFVDEIDQILADTGLPANRLVVEVTEHVFVDSPEPAAEALGALRERGIRVSVDDFGTGYASLGYLNRLPLDALKIDRTFVRDMGGGGSERFVWAIIALARGLELDVIAEGVETEAQRSDLARLGCRTVQGFLFAQPLEPDEAARWRGAE